MISPTLLHALQNWDQWIRTNPNQPKAYIQRGMAHFKLGQIAESIQDFDQAERLDPRLTPYLWQRGLSYYYANRFAEGARQFEIDLTVNAQDVEETVWRYLCMAQLEGVEAAKRALLPVRNDFRRIMGLIYELFAGVVDPDSVLSEGISEGTSEGTTEAPSKFYSQLYVGLYYEAVGAVELAKTYISEAVHTFETQYQSDDYMGYLAIVHQTQRGWG